MLAPDVDDPGPFPRRENPAHGVRRTANQFGEVLLSHIKGDPGSGVYGAHGEAGEPKERPRDAPLDTPDGQVLEPVPTSFDLPRHEAEPSERDPGVPRHEPGDRCGIPGDRRARLRRLGEDAVICSSPDRDVPKKLPRPDEPQDDLAAPRPRPD